MISTSDTGGFQISGGTKNRKHLVRKQVFDVKSRYSFDQFQIHVIYCARLGGTHTGTEEALESWCVYLFSGVRDELTNVVRLADYHHLQAKVHEINQARERRLSSIQLTMHTTAIKSDTVKTADLEATMHDLNANQRT